MPGNGSVRRSGSPSCWSAIGARSEIYRWRPPRIRELEGRLRRFDFAEPVGLDELLDSVGGLLRDGIVHTAHPRYFGLFNPTPAFAGVLADSLVAAFNPQLAVASHAPAAVAIERHVLSFIGGCLGLPDAGQGFTSGGAEANLTAVLVALERHFPEATERGLAAVDGQPTLYCSVEAHHSLVKAARRARARGGARDPGDRRAQARRRRAAPADRARPCRGPAPVPDRGDGGQHRGRRHRPVDRAGGAR